MITEQLGWLLYFLEILTVFSSVFEILDQYQPGSYCPILAVFHSQPRKLCITTVNLGSW